MKTRTLSSLVALATLAASLPFAVDAAETAPQQSPPSAARIPTPEPSPVIPVTPTVAPGYQAPNVAPTSADVVGVTQQPFVGITLDDAIGMALVKNPDLAVSAEDTRISGYQIRSVKGAYNVKFFVEPSISHSTVAPENAFFSGPNFGPVVQNQQSLTAGVSGQTTTGGTYNVNIVQSRTDNNTIINAFNPYWAASLNVSVTQPLLRGFLGNSETQRQLQLASANEIGTTAQTYVTASNTISNVSNTYWDLVAAWRNVAIQEDALHQAILQQQSNVRLAKRGAAAPIDAVESSTQVATYQNAVFAALQNVSQLQNSLKSQIVDDPADMIWMANLVPTSTMPQAPNIPPLATILTNAMANRPELREVLATQQQADINLRYSKDQLKPQVDLQLSYQGNGFAGNALPPLGGAFGTATPPPYLGGTYGVAYSNIGRFPTYNAGVVISTPIGNETAKANLASAQSQERIAKLQTVSVDQRILFEVRNAVQGYESALARLYAARKAREASAEVYASEQRKFRNGESTTFLVTQRQVELVQNQGIELQAQTDLNKAIVELQRVQGTILSANNVTLEKLGSQAVKP